MPVIDRSNKLQWLLLCSTTTSRPLVLELDHENQ